MTKTVELDRINRRILAELQSDARITNVVLAERVGLSPSACLKRVQALEGAGCIRTYTAVINFDRVADYIHAYLSMDLIDTTAATRARFEEQIRSHPNVVDCVRLGGDPDYVAYVYAADVDDLTATIDKITNENPGIARANASIIMEFTKRWEGFPLHCMNWKSRV